jgi:hypothetical protein
MLKHLLGGVAIGLSVFALVGEAQAQTFPARPAGKPTLTTDPSTKARPDARIVVAST